MTHHPVGVLLTQWGEPEGFHPAYRKDVARRTRGEPARRPDEPGTEHYVGEFPFRSSVGMLPFAVCFPLNGLESAHDSYGFYRLDGDEYVNVYDPRRRLPRDAVVGPIVPAAQSSHRPARSAWGRTPHDDVDRFADIWEIGQPSGIPDVDETAYLAAMGDEDILFGSIEPRLSEPVRHVNRRVAELLGDWFGDAVVVRTGAYADARPLMVREDDAACELVRRGIYRLVLARETTDSNSYANDFMTRGFIETALTRAGLRAQVSIRQVRQVGRTPEYNRALLSVIRPHLDAVPDGTGVAVVYATYGLPFPGRDTAGPFTTPHPWVREVYHENALLNYLSFRRFLAREVGDRLTLSFGSNGLDGSQRRTSSYFGYAMSAPADFADMPLEIRFQTLREALDRAIADGHREILVVLSHWIDDNRDTLLALRLLQDLPLNSRAEIAGGKRWIDWYDGDAHITLAAAFDAAAEAFAIGYAHRLRGGVEAFGELPIGTRAAAWGDISRADGGHVSVTSGPLAGASLTVAAAPDPAAPWRFTVADYRVVNTPADAMLSAWDDFPAYLGETDLPLATLPVAPLGPVVVVGPYRTIVNRPARLVLPVTSQTRRRRVTAYLYDHVAQSWVPVDATPRWVSGGVELDVDVFGAYVAAPDAST